MIDYNVDNNADKVISFEELQRSLGQEMIQQAGNENYYITFNSDTDVYIIYPYMDYTKIVKYKDNIMNFFSSKEEYKNKNIYIISGDDLRNGKNRWSKSEK